MIVRKPLEKKYILNRIFVRMALVIVTFVVVVVCVCAFFFFPLFLYFSPSPPPPHPPSSLHSLELLRATICNYNLVEK